MLWPEHFAQWRASIAADHAQIRHSKIDRGQCLEQPVAIHRLVVRDAPASCNISWCKAMAARVFRHCLKRTEAFARKQCGNCRNFFICQVFIDLWLLRF
jgi:hypothetical protein